MLRFQIHLEKVRRARKGDSAATKSRLPGSVAPVHCNIDLIHCPSIGFRTSHTAHRGARAPQPEYSLLSRMPEASPHKRSNEVYAYAAREKRMLNDFPPPPLPLT